MSLLLTIDLGNTNTVLGVFEGTELRAHWRLATRREQTADEYGILVRNLFASSGLAPAGIEGVALASVVPPLTPVLVALSKQYLSLEPLVVEPGVRTGMPILYEPPADVGADRIVNGVAAFAAYGGPVIVVDFGTATTLDVVTRKGEYLGGRDPVHRSRGPRADPHRPPPDLGAEPTERAMMTAADPEAAYYQAIEEYFVSRRGDPLFLSSADWHLIRKWRQAGIPLRVVLRGIRDALDGHAHSWGRERKVGSLAYCEQEVEVARERWGRSLALGQEPGLDAAGALRGFARHLERAQGLGPRGREAAVAT